MTECVYIEAKSLEISNITLRFLPPKMSYYVSNHSPLPFDPRTSSAVLDRTAIYPPPT
jgi:hypothetical protein